MKPEIRSVPIFGIQEAASLQDLENRPVGGLSQDDRTLSFRRGATGRLDQLYKGQVRLIEADDINCYGLFSLEDVEQNILRV